MRMIRNVIWIAVVGLGCTSLAVAQEYAGSNPPGSNVPPVGGPVDRAVTDVDPLSAQFRQVERGHSHAVPFVYQFSPMDTRSGPAVNQKVAGEFPGRTREYYYESPGVRAWIQRPEYMVEDRFDPWEENMVTDHHPKNDGEFVAMAPPNTVYDLVPQPAFQPASVPIITGADGYQFLNQIDPPSPAQMQERRTNTYVDIQPMDKRIEPYRRPQEVRPPQPAEQEAELVQRVRAIQQEQNEANRTRVAEARREQWLKERKALAEERGMLFDPETGRTIPANDD